MYKNKLLPTDFPAIISLLKEGKTYQEIGTQFNVSRERIRQIAKKAELHRHGLTMRRNKQLGNYEAKMKEKYGSFWQGGFVDKSDFMYACKEKFRYKKNSARQVGIEFSISMEDLEWPRHCPILGIELDYLQEGGRQENSVSFGRYDLTKGYVADNVFICSWRANRIKNDGTIEEHKKIYEFMLSTLGSQD